MTTPFWTALKSAVVGGAPGGQGLQRLSLTVRGMSCARCQAAVTRALRQVAGVTAATVDLASGRADVAGTHLDEATLRRAVEALGYSVQGGRT
jgi:copper chaperone CopZ